MRSDLKTVTIDQAVELIIDHRGRTPKKLGGDFAELGIQVISAKNVYDGRLQYAFRGLGAGSLGLGA